jgi:hypothetical protein
VSNRYLTQSYCRHKGFSFHKNPLHKKVLRERSVNLSGVEGSPASIKHGSAPLTISGAVNFFVSPQSY